MPGDPRPLASASRPRRLRSLLALAVPAAVALGLVVAYAPEAAAGLPLLLPVAAVRGSPTNPSLANETRKAIFERVCQVPGSTIAEAAEAVDVSHSTATYHLEKLAETDLVVSIEDGNKRRFFPNAGAYDADERRALAALENGTTREMLELLVREGPATRTEMAESLDVAQPTVNWHLDRLQDCDLVFEDETRGRRLLTVDADAVRDLVGGLVEKLTDTGYETAPLTEILPGDGSAAEA